MTLKVAYQWHGGQKTKRAFLFTPVQRCLNNGEKQCLIFVSDRAEEGGNTVALLTDDNAVLAQIVGIVFTVILTADEICSEYCAGRMLQSS